MLISKLQKNFSSVLTPLKISSFGVETADKPTTTIIHSAARFWIFTEGKGKITINGVEYKIEKNTMVAIMPWDITIISEVEETFTFYKIVYNYNFINSYLRTMYNPTSVPLSLFNDIEKYPATVLENDTLEKMISTFMEIRDEVGSEECMDYIQPKPLSETYIISLLVRIIVLYTRASKREVNTTQENKEVETISSILRYMYSHLQEKVTLSKLSALFFMSEQTITKHLQIYIGYTFSELLNQMRLNKAINFLICSDLTLQEIAYFVGYTDASHFIKTFISKIGVSPTEFREVYQKDEQIVRTKESYVTFKVLDYIHNNYTNENISVVGVAKEFEISTTELNRITLYQVERDFDEYVEWLRINKAKELLTTTNETITDIAIEVGFNTIRTFQRSFNRLTAVTASEFRKNNKYQNFDGKIIENN